MKPFKVASTEYATQELAEIAAKKRAAERREDTVIWQATSVAKAIIPDIQIVPYTPAAVIPESDVDWD